MSNLLAVSNGTGVSFDDVLLTPSYSESESRLSVSLKTKVAHIDMLVPVISSPMDTVTESSMAIDIAMLGGFGIVHRFMSQKNQLFELRNVARHNRNVAKKGWAPVVPAVGVGKDELDRLQYLISGMPDLIDAIAIDIANGHSILAKQMVQSVLDMTGGDIPIIAGNVATYEGFCFLADLGVSAVRVGIGGGSICKTRVMTGFGLPTLTSVALAYKAKVENAAYSDVAIIADGGIRYPSDLVKSLAAGADAVICGKVLAGTNSSPGGVVSVGGKSMKLYRGMASSEAQVARGTGKKPGTCAEGVSTHIPHVGSLDGIIEEFSGGLRSGMTYVGASNINDLRSGASFMIVSGASQEESHAFGTKE